METQTKNTTIPGQTTARKPSVADVKDGEKYQSGPFRPKASLLLDVMPAEKVKAAGGKSNESPEGLLQQLLINTEASAQRTQVHLRKWQFSTLMLAMLFAVAGVVIVWLYIGLNAASVHRGRLEIENQSLREQINTAGAQITGFKDEVEVFLSRNIELAGENAKLKSQGSATLSASPDAAVKAEQKPVEPSQSAALKTITVSENALDAGRIEAIRKGVYPNGASKAELVAAMGEPDRVYKSRYYEQLVYFGRKPGRFWLIGNHLVQTAE